MADTGEDRDVARWFTSARRFPKLIGKTSDGKRIWGGPYTHTQAIGGVLACVVTAKVLFALSAFGFIANIAILAMITAGVVFALGRISLGGRSPLTIASGALNAAMRPKSGTYAGARVALPKPHMTGTKCVVADFHSLPPVTEQARTIVPFDEVETEVPAEVATASSPVPLTNIQRLLAASPQE